VYLKLTGVLQLPEGDFGDAQLKQILVNGFSAYLDFPKEFITILMLQRNDDISNVKDANASTGNVSNVTDANASTGNSSYSDEDVSNVTDANASTGNSSNSDEDSSNVTDANVSTGNSSTNRRRLLNDFPVQLDFEVVCQIEKDDKIMQDKIENFAKDSNKIINAMTEGIPYRIVARRAELTQGWITGSGKPVEECQTGYKSEVDYMLKKLVCLLQKPDTSHLFLGGGIGAGVLLVLIIVIVVAVKCRRPGHVDREQRTKQQREETKQLLGRQGIELTRRATRANLLLPTVSFEYQLLPGQSI
jgi:hypothetical protein